jgi:hypothetical protein
MQQLEEHSSLSMLQELKRSSKRLPPTRVGRKTQPTRAKRVHQIDGVDMLAAKMDLLTKKLESLH